ncbi:DNA-directed RNA polymerase [Radiomyces spectabilis]|uniref:DNA-directed RNA polymerase n=1 Tax=Radiomyces spectabilis TaxID=64574 RepID=UPI00221E5970|nr:DNA-directed RNA polymerase [Radiomyces spectabilis]KAI8370465.1 DNA-directed RNA polymerase [Radiomyces spectabilis]
MNAPDRFELFVIPEGKKKVEMEVDTKIPNAATFIIEREDHTLANMLRAQLLKDPRVLFAGYKVPHPLEHNFVIKVQTTTGTTPGKVLKEATSELISELNALRNKFDMDVIRYRTVQDAKASQDVNAYDADGMGGVLDPQRAAMDVDF